MARRHRIGTEAQRLVRVSRGAGLALTGAALLWFGTATAAGQSADLSQPVEGAQAVQTLPATAADDPPARVARLSQLSGDVSAEPASVDTFAPAELNQVLTSGDRIYTDAGAQAELQAGPLAVRLGGGADLTVTALTDTLAQFGLAAGSVHLRSFSIAPGTVLELDTADAAITVLQAGDVRVDNDPAGHTTTVSVTSGQVQLDGPGLSRVLNAGDRVRVTSGDPASGQVASVQPLPFEGTDTLDSFSEGRDSSYASGEAASNAFLNADVTGGADLASYGSWDSCDFGPVWYPVVSFGWQPYRTGRWAWVPPWGWTWIGAEPWGFAPFHYGRWAYLGGRWGWLPGPPRLHAVYAPALVGFVGGTRSATLGRDGEAGRNAAAGLVGWFPLGPREPYVPPYGASTHYRNRVNASNIFDPNTVQARAFYNQRAVNAFAGTAAADQVYSHRARATVALPLASFAAGLPVGRNALHAPEELADEPVTTHLVATPWRTAIAMGNARSLPLQIARPTHTGHPGEADPAGSVEAGLASRPLIHRAEPPILRPGFPAVQARPMPGEAFPRSEAGRMERPTGAVPAREAAPHPLPAHEAPAPVRSAPPPPAVDHKK